MKQFMIERPKTLSEKLQKLINRQVQLLTRMY